MPRWQAPEVPKATAPPEAAAAEAPAEGRRTAEGPEGSPAAAAAAEGHRSAQVPTLLSKLLRVLCEVLVEDEEAH